MLTYSQVNIDIPESGGLLLGYLDTKTRNDTVSSMTEPQTGDTQTRIYYGLKAGRHFALLMQAMKQKNYFIGTWHTHPQMDPCPSGTDWGDWRRTLSGAEAGAYKYLYFMILGTEKMKIWAGDVESKEIVELKECERASGLYRQSGINTKEV